MNITIIVISSYIVGVISAFGWGMTIRALKRRAAEKQMQNTLKKSNIEEEKDEGKRE